MHGTFGLIVTGKGERDFLPRFFRSLMERADCHFIVHGRIGQRDPITSQAVHLQMIKTNKIIPTKDEVEIALPARRFIRGHPDRFLILIDDVEEARRLVIDQVFNRYRNALHALLSPQERERAAVHFMANMLEAYYFAHSAAVNQALGHAVLSTDFVGDVENIRHPKAELKNLFQGFDERIHGALIVPLLELDHILSNPQSCAFLRSLFDWCIRRLLASCVCWDAELQQRYRRVAGVKAIATCNQ